MLGYFRRNISGSLHPVLEEQTPSHQDTLCPLRWRKASVQLSDNGEAKITKNSFGEGGRAQERNTHTHTCTRRACRDVLAMDSTIALQLATVSIERAHYEQIAALSFHSHSIDERLFVWRRSALTYFELVCSCAIVSGSVRFILDGEWRTFKEIAAERWKRVSKDARFPCEPQLFPCLLQNTLPCALPRGEQGVCFRAEQGEVPRGLHEPL